MRKGLAAFVLLLVYSTALAEDRQRSLLFIQPNASEAIPPPEGDEESPLLEELAWRAIAMRDETGIIPIGAVYRANVFRRQQLLQPIKIGVLRTSAHGPMPSSYISSSLWVSRGPQNVGGRTRSLLIDPVHPNIMYAGAVSGGVWKSIDSGFTWSALTDFNANMAITTMAFDPTDITNSTSSQEQASHTHVPTAYRVPESSRA